MIIDVDAAKLSTLHISEVYVRRAIWGTRCSAPVMVSVGFSVNDDSATSVGKPSFSNAATE